MYTQTIRTMWRFMLVLNVAFTLSTRAVSPVYAGPVNIITTGVNSGSVSISPDGKLLAIGGVKTDAFVGMVRVWRISTKGKVENVLSLDEPETNFYTVSFTPDSRCIVVGGSFASKNVRMLDLTTKKTKAVFPHAEHVRSFSISADGKYLATATFDARQKDMIVLWDLKTQRQIGFLYGHTSGIRKVRFSPDGQLIGSAGCDGDIRLWSVRDRKLTRSMSLSANFNGGLAFSADGSLLAAGTVEGRVHVWQVDKADVPVIVLNGQKDGIFSLAFHPKKRCLLVGGYVNRFKPVISNKGTVQAWDVKGKRRFAETLVHEYPVLSIAVAANGKIAATTSADGTVRLWPCDRKGILRVHGRD